MFPSTGLEEKKKLLLLSEHKQLLSYIYFDGTYLKKFRAFIISEFNYTIIVAKRIRDNDIL